MKTVFAATLTAVLFFQAPRASSSSPSRWPAFGPSCTAFTKSAGADRDVYTSFVLGIVAGTNRERDGENQVTFGLEDIAKRLTTFCKSHNSAPLADAAFALVDEVKTQRP